MAFIQVTEHEHAPIPAYQTVHDAADLSSLVLSLGITAAAGLGFKVIYQQVYQGSGWGSNGIPGTAAATGVDLDVSGVIRRLVVELSAVLAEPSPAGRGGAVGNYYDNIDQNYVELIRANPDQSPKYG